METNYSSKNRKRTLFVLATVAALAFAIAAFIYFSLQPKEYRALGRYAVYYISSKEGADYLTDSDITKSVAEAIKSKSFAEKLFAGTNVKFSNNSDVTDIMSTSVVSNSNIVQVILKSTSTNILDKVNDKFSSQLDKLSIVSDGRLGVVILPIDPMYTENQPIYPKPLKYSLVVFGTVLIVGFFIVYVIED